MKSAVFDYQTSRAELALTRDTQSQEWLSVVRLHLEELPRPALLSGPAIDSQLSEEKAWEAAAQWATNALPIWWLELSTATG